MKKTIFTMFILFSFMNAFSQEMDILHAFVTLAKSAEDSLFASYIEEQINSDGKQTYYKSKITVKDAISSEFVRNNINGDLFFRAILNKSQNSYQEAYKVIEDCKSLFSRMTHRVDFIDYIDKDRLRSIGIAVSSDQVIDCYKAKFVIRYNDIDNYTTEFIFPAAKKAADGSVIESYFTEYIKNTIGCEPGNFRYDFEKLLYMNEEDLAKFKSTPYQSNNPNEKVYDSKWDVSGYSDCYLYYVSGMSYYVIPCLHDLQPDSVVPKSKVLFKQVCEALGTAYAYSESKDFNRITFVNISYPNDARVYMIRKLNEKKLIDILILIKVETQDKYDFKWIKDI